MSHFVTLVNFYMPKLEENCEENMRYAEQIAEVKEKLAQDPESFALRFLLKRLQSKASTLERSAECEIDELMAPFCEGTDDPAYLEFEDRTDDLRQDYETDKINCIRFPDGTVVPEYSRLVCEKYLIKDGKVFQKKAGHLGHEKRTKKAKKMRAFMGYPVKKLYPSLKQYAEDYCGYTFDSKNNAYGYYCNPNAFWDWYSIGGRWPFQFLVRDTAERINGERSWGNEDAVCEAPEGYIPKYGTVVLKGVEYYRTRIEDADGRRVALYARTPEELLEKVEEAQRQIENAVFRRTTPTVAEYCERWLTMQSARIRPTTLIDYTSKVKNYIIEPLGHKYMAEVSSDDIKLAMVNVSSKSCSVYRSVQMLYKCIFYSAVESKIIDSCPCETLSSKGGKPQNEREALTDEQVDKLLVAIKGLPPYVFVMIGLYAGLRREEILALKWDCVFLDAEAPYLSVQRAWHSEHNRPVISSDLKTKSARRDIPLPSVLTECLREAKEVATSEYVVANRDGDPLSYTQFKRVWQYIVTRSTKERTYVRYINGQKIQRTVTPKLGEKAAHNGNVVYTLDFQVTPHQLRHTYITNLIYSGADPKTVQYLAGHKHSKITMDIYAKVKYNKPKELSSVVNKAFAPKKGATPNKMRKG